MSQHSQATAHRVTHDTWGTKRRRFVPAPALATRPTAVGTVSGRVILPADLAPVHVVPLAPGQTAYTVSVPPGTYQAYTWLPGFTRKGASRQPVVVSAGGRVDGTGAPPIPEAATTPTPPPTFRRDRRSA